MEHENDDDTNYNWIPWNGLQEPEKRLDELEIRGRIETILATTELKLLGIPRRVLEIMRGTCCHSDFSEKQPVRAGVKNSQGVY